MSRDNILNAVNQSFRHYQGNQSSRNNLELENERTPNQKQSHQDYKQSMLKLVINASSKSKSTSSNNGGGG